jgi:hypothetical protein
MMKTFKVMSSGEQPNNAHIRRCSRVTQLYCQELTVPILRLLDVPLQMFEVIQDNLAGSAIQKPWLEWSMV